MEKLNKSKKQKEMKSKIRALNPKFQYFNLQSSFIYESRLCDFHYLLLPNYNQMKPSTEDIKLFEKEILNIKESEDDLEKLKSKINIPYYFAGFFSKMEKKDLILNEKEKAIENIVNNHNNSKSLSCTKIAHIYCDKYNDKISNVSVYRILTKKLGFSFRKTSAKTNKLLSKQSQKQTFFVLRIIARIIKLGGQLIYIDESAFYNANNNYKMWRRNNQEIYFDFQEDKKINLILAVSSSKIIYYKITSGPTNEDTFKLFMEELYESLTEQEKEKYCFFLDNLSSHSTAELFSLYKEKKMKIIFNCPYRSNFNMVELCFRHIKRETYTHLYSNIESVKKDINNILNGENIKKCLKNFYRRTLEEYLNYINKNISFNLN